MGKEGQNLRLSIRNSLIRAAIDQFFEDWPDVRHLVIYIEQCRGLEPGSKEYLDPLQRFVLNMFKTDKAVFFLASHKNDPWITEYYELILRDPGIKELIEDKKKYKMIALTRSSTRGGGYSVFPKNPDIKL